MVHTASIVLFATVALNGASTFATPIGQPQVSLEARDIEALSQVLGRDLSQGEIEELYARGWASTAGKLLKTGAKYVGKALPYAAAALPFIPMGGSDDKKESRSVESGSVEARSIEEWSEIFGRDLSEREIDELYARGWASSTGKLLKTGAKYVGKALPYAAAALPFIPMGGSDDKKESRSVESGSVEARSIEEWSEIFGRELSEREIDELYARGWASSAGKLLKTGAKYVGKALPYAAAALPFIPMGGSDDKKESRSLESGSVEARSIEEWSEIFGRDLSEREIDELYARGWASSAGKILKTGAKYIGKALPYAAAALPFIPMGGSDDKKEARSIEEWSEIFGRDFVEVDTRELENLIMGRGFDELENLD